MSFDAIRCDTCMRVPKSWSVNLAKREFECDGCHETLKISDALLQAASLPSEIPPRFTLVSHPLLSVGGYREAPAPPSELDVRFKQGDWQNGVLGMVIGAGFVVAPPLFIGAALKTVSFAWQVVLGAFIAVVVLVGLVITWHALRAALTRSVRMRTSNGELHIETKPWGSPRFQPVNLADITGLYVSGSYNHTPGIGSYDVYGYANGRHITFVEALRYEKDARFMKSLLSLCTGLPEARQLDESRYEPPSPT